LVASKVIIATVMVVKMETARQSKELPMKAARVAVSAMAILMFGEINAMEKTMYKYRGNPEH
jgi:hypothetical protein